MNARRGCTGSSVRARLAAKAKSTKPPRTRKPQNDFIELLIPLNKEGKKDRDNRRDPSGGCHSDCRKSDVPTRGKRSPSLHKEGVRGRFAHPSSNSPLVQGGTRTAPSCRGLHAFNFHPERYRRRRNAS